jgi:DNA-binding transcriptional regulator YhcF (GntR family)
VSSNESRAKREYQRVADALRGQIEVGDLVVGAQLPTHGQLTKHFTVSRATVQRALKVLQSAGYVESFQGRGVFVADWSRARQAQQGPGGVAERAGSTLGVSDIPSASSTAGAAGASAASRLEGASGFVRLEDALAAAFEEEEVGVDAYCLTAESLYPAFVPQIGRLQRGEVRPKAIEVRLLLPRVTGVQLAIPRAVHDPDDLRPLQRLGGLIDLQTRNLVHLLQDAKRFGVEVSVTVGRLPITPLVKVYLINKEIALTGYYLVDTNTVDLDGESVEIQDVLGIGARLSPQGPAQRDECRAWWDRLWDNVAEV